MYRIVKSVYLYVYYYVCVYNGVRRVSGLRREPVVSLKNPTLIPNSHWKDDPDPLVGDSDPLVASSVRVFCAQNSQREGRSLPREGRDHLFLWDVGISVGFSTGTTGSLRNPETRRTPSYVTIVNWGILVQF